MQTLLYQHIVQQAIDWEVLVYDGRIKSQQFSTSVLLLCISASCSFAFKL